MRGAKRSASRQLRGKLRTTSFSSTRHLAPSISFEPEARSGCDWSSLRRRREMGVGYEVYAAHARKCDGVLIVF